MVNRRVVGLAVVLVVQTIVLSNGWAADGDVYEVGVAQVDITPDYPIRLNGFGSRREECTEIRQRIWAKALAIASPTSKPVVLLAIDSLGVRMDMVDEVARRLGQSHGIPRENIALTFSHSHCTPKVSGASDNIFSTAIAPDHQAHIDRYTQALTDALYKVAVSALSEMRNCRLERGSGTVEFAINRRTPGGPVDHDLPVLIARDEQGNVHAIYVSYACHCVALTENKISGDWAGYAQEFLQRQFPGAIALVSIGAGSDSNPNLRQSDETASAAISLGSDIARETNRVLGNPLTPITGNIAAQLNTISLPLKTLPGKQELESQVTAGGPAGYNAQTQLDRLQRGLPLLKSVDYPIQSWRFGDEFAIVFLAGEVCVDYSLRLKQELNRDRLWINAYSNDFCCYIPSERLMQEGGYGGGAEIPYFALPTTLESGLEKQIVDEVKRQLPDSILTKPGTRGIPPKSPQASLRCIMTHPQFSVELVAAEPLVADPVAIDFDPGGGLWVAEMPDYGNPVDTHIEPHGKIKFLTDQDGDGVFDRSTDFAAGFLFPTDVKCWRDGVLVCDSPDIIFLQDTDGDGRADVRKVMYTGFETHNPHARVNSLRWGLDNWLYGSGGLFGGNITSHQGQKLELGARDFRIQPDAGVIQAATGRTQQGRARDDWGHWFGCDNGTLVFHYPLSEDYLSRNPFATPPATSVGIAADQTLFPAGELVTFKLTGPPGVPTSACGLTVYRDNLLGSEYAGNCFVAEPVNQLVHRRVLVPRGATFSANRAGDESRSEFLTSTDQWFRPVQVRTGPDGALWIVDMYRFVIEHPRWIADEVKSELDIFAGQQLGRIYRVIPINRTLRPITDLRTMSSEQLVAAIDQDNGVQRDLAHQLLLWRDDRSVTESLERLAVDAKHPVAKIHAMHLLQHDLACSPEVLTRVLDDQTPGVRCHAIKLSEPLLASHPELMTRVLWLAGDTDFEVAMQAIYSLGSIIDRRCTEAIANVASTSYDPYLDYAILTGVNANNIAEMVEKVLSWNADVDAPLRDELLWMALEFDDDESIDRVVQNFFQLSHEQRKLWQLNLMSRSLANFPQRILDSRWLHSQAGQRSLDALTDDCRNVALDERQTAETRCANIRLLAEVTIDPEKTQSDFSQLMTPDQDIELQLAAIELLTRGKHPAAAELMIGQLTAATPELARHLVATLLERDEWAMELLNACLSDPRLGQWINPQQRQQLNVHGNPNLRKLAKQVFQLPSHSDRQTLAVQYRSAVSDQGSVPRGKALFSQHCAKCHLSDDSHHAVGPNLAGLTSRNRHQLLESILDPNRDIDSRYMNYVVQLDDGRSVMGIVSDETSTSLVLNQQDGTRQTILRRDIEAFRNSGLSFMPEGLEREIAPPEMSDLIEYLVSLNEPPKSLAGNVPRVILPNQSGNILLPASAANLFGKEIIFEQPLENIGYWHDQNDYAIWDIQSPSAGVYQITLEYACPDSNAGNRFRIDGLESTLTGIVESTGGWDQYKTFELGSVELPAGGSRITVSADGPISGALFDLREVLLVPITGNR